jgi:hypothetical protein
MTAINDTKSKSNRRQPRASLQRDFMPNLDLRRVVALVVFAAGGSAVQAQTSVPPPEAGVSVTAAANPAQGATATMIQTRSGGNPLDAAFKRADTNGDGRLSRKEAEHFPMLSQRFDALDGDGDEFLSRDEFDRAISN